MADTKHCPVAITEHDRRSDRALHVGGSFAHRHLAFNGRRDLPDGARDFDLGSARPGPVVSRNNWGSSASWARNGSW